MTDIRIIVPRDHESANDRRAREEIEDEATRLQRRGWSLVGVTLADAGHDGADRTTRIFAVTMRRAPTTPTTPSEIQQAALDSIIQDEGDPR